MAKKRLSTMQIRQGDVMLIRIAAIPKAARQINVGRRIVLAYGEATGHAHAVCVEAPAAKSDADLQLLMRGDVRFLQIGSEPAILKHEEHVHATLEAASTWQVHQQRENSPLGWRSVSD